MSILEMKSAFWNVPQGTFQSADFSFPKLTFPNYLFQNGHFLRDTLKIGALALALYTNTSLAPVCLPVNCTNYEVYLLVTGHYFTIASFFIIY